MVDNCVQRIFLVLFQNQVDRKILQCFVFQDAVLRHFPIELEFKSFERDYEDFGNLFTAICFRFLPRTLQDEHSTSSIISLLKFFSKNGSPRETLMARKLSNRTESASQFSQETVLLNCPNMVSRNSLEIPWQSCAQAIGSHSDTLQQKKLPNFDESSPQFLKRILLLDRPFPVPIFLAF